MADKEFLGEFAEPNLPFQFKMLRTLVFAIGDLKWTGRWPMPFGWQPADPKITLNEVILEALPLLQPGDVILHRDEGFFSNLFIGGVMIHAGLYVGGGQLVEAISDGVVKRHAAHILHSDLACILRPKLDYADKAKAMAWSEKIIGFPYDYLFDFNGKWGRDMIIQHGIRSREKGVRFACTEVPYFCYLEKTADLKIFRRKNVNVVTRMLSLLGMRPGSVVVDADMYFKSDMELVWCSSTMTPAYISKCYGGAIDEAYAYKLDKWWKDKTAKETAE